MRRLYITLIIFMIPASSLAQSPNQKAEAEARSFLIPCKLEDQAQRNCQGSQRNFIRTYVRAKAGEFSAMGSTAASFQGPWIKAPDFTRDLYIGMPLNRIHACAWRIVQANTPLTAEDQEQPIGLQELELENRVRFAKDICSKLPDEDQFAARRRAEVLIQELHTAPARTPPNNWSPTVP